MTSITVPVKDLETLAVDILVANGTGEAIARSVARTLVAAECDGQGGHGLSRLASYAAQAKSGKVAGQAVPQLIDLTPAAVRIDARHGFAYPAMDLAVETVCGARAFHRRGRGGGVQFPSLRSCWVPRRKIG